MKPYKVHKTWKPLSLFLTLILGCQSVSSSVSTNVSAKEPSIETELRNQFNLLKMNKLHGRENAQKDREKLAKLGKIHLASQAERQFVDRPSHWSDEDLDDPDFGKFRLTHFLRSLEGWVTLGKKVDKEDLGINFAWSNNNTIKTLSDKEQVWPQLMQDLKSAKSTINIIMFGLSGDEWGREVFGVLADRVKQGVKVRLLVDALGAREHCYFKYTGRPFLDEMRAQGIEVLSTSTPVSQGLHFDHRKIYVIDGKLAYNTGYTIESHMRRIHFDMAFRITGDMVNQLQGHFFASYFYFGGVLPAPERDFKSFMTRYFPPADGPREKRAGTAAHLLPNVPWVQHRATETYYDKIAKARSKVVVLNEFLSEPRFLKLLESKAREGVHLQVIYPRVSEWSVHRYDAFSFFEKIKKHKNVDIFMFDGPENTGWLHTKGIVIDRNYVSFGSTNMDSLSLFHNFEINIESQDPRLVAEVETQIVDYAIKYSRRYELPKDLLEQMKVWMSPLTTIPLKYFFKAM